MDAKPLIKIKSVLGIETNPYVNLAIEADLMQHVESSTVIIYLWQNDNTIVIGRNQDAFQECKVYEFEKNGGLIARRRSGGGAVFHDLGNLNFSIICERKNKERFAYWKIIRKALTYFGIETDFNGRNDLLYQGRKFSGNAVYDDGRIVCQHGTILVDSDIDKMMKYLTPATNKLKRNHVSSVASRVINLKEVSADINIHSLKESILYSLKVEKLDYIPIETEKYFHFFSDKKWIYGDK